MLICPKVTYRLKQSHWKFQIILEKNKKFTTLFGKSKLKILSKSKFCKCGSQKCCLKMPVLSNIKPRYKTTVVKKESRILANKIAQWNRIEAHKLNRKM